MYKRDVAIEEENLDWGEKAKKTVKEPYVNVPSELKSPKSFQHEKTGLSLEFAKKKSLMALLGENIGLFAIVGILIIPYIFGFLITFLLYSFYGGMTIAGFFTIDKEYLPFQLWSMGAYLFVTAWVIWAVLNTFKRDR